MKVVTWSPGNGTRYEVLITKLPVDAAGHPAGTYMVVGPWPDRSRVVFVTPGSFIHYSWIGEKMAIGPHDASVVAMMVAPHTGGTAGTLPSLFEHYAGAPRGEPVVVEG